MWFSCQRCFCKHAENPTDVEYLTGDAQIEAVLRAGKTGNEHLGVATVMMAPARNANAAAWGDPSQPLTKEEYEARLGKLQQMMKDLQASAPYDVRRELECNADLRDDHQAPQSSRPYSDDSDIGYSHRSNETVPELKTLFNPQLDTPTVVARHTPVHASPADAKFHKEDLAKSQNTPRQGAPASQGILVSSYVPQDNYRSSSGGLSKESTARSSSVDHLDQLQTAWAELERTKALLGVQPRRPPASVTADAAEREVLAMLAADATDASSDGGYTARTGSTLQVDTILTHPAFECDRQDSGLSRDLELMLEEVKRLEKLRSAEVSLFARRHQARTRQQMDSGTK